MQSGSNFKFSALVEVLASPLGRKGIIIVAIPLCLCAAFIGLLRFFLQEASAAAEREARSKEIIFKANSFGAEMVQVGAAYYMTRMGGSRESFVAKVDKVRSDFAELEQLVPANSTRGELLAKTRKNLEKLYAELTNRWEKKYLETEQFGPEDAKAVKVSLPALVNITVKDMNQVAVEERLERKRHPMTFEKYRSYIDLFLLAGLAVNAAVAMFLIAYFSTGITRRVLVVTDNAQRLTQAKELLPPVEGTDEIAVLDKVFHDMADQLNEAHAKEQRFIESLKLSESRLRSIIDTVPLGLVMVDEFGSIKIFNSSAEKIFGRSSEEAGGLGIQTVLPDLPTNLDPRLPRETKAVRGSADSFPAEVLSTEYVTADMKGHLLVITDITQRYEVEKLKQQFVSMVSHELRSPLMSIQTCMSMLLDGLFGEISAEGMRSVTIAEKSAIRLISLVNEILDVERLESGSISITPELTPVREIYDLSVGAIWTLSEKKKITVVTDNTDASVFVDKDRIVQVLVNLLSNAVKFSESSSRIEVRTTVEGDFATIFVQDFGRGIPPAQLDRVFDRFYQVSKTDASEKGGSGLGLAICQAITNAHGGKIGVESTLGAGSTFWFTLPLNDPED